MAAAQAHGCLDISKDCTPNLTCYPCPLWGIFRRFLAGSVALSLQKPSSQEVLLPRSILHQPTGVSHPWQAHTVPFPQPSHPRAPPTLPNPHPTPFSCCTGMSSSPGLAKKPHARGKSFPASNDSHFLKGKFPYSAHSVLTRTAGKEGPTT